MLRLTVLAQVIRPPDGNMDIATNSGVNRGGDHGCKRGGDCGGDHAGNIPKHIKDVYDAKDVAVQMRIDHNARRMDSETWL